MSSAVKLKANNLSQLSGKVRIPCYDRSKIKSGIVHVGVGNFHRAHQAFYTEKLLNLGVSNWGICGVGLLEGDAKMGRILSEQDGLYTLVVKNPDGRWDIQVIGALNEYQFGPENPSAVIERISDSAVKIISLTITEGGYYFDGSNEEFLISHPAIQWDLHHPEQPKTVFGYLTRAFIQRRDRRLPGLTVLSCDNIQQNGNVCRKMLSAFIRETEPALSSWIADHVMFPNCMVDRITPATTTDDMNELKNQYGIEDQWPVLCEPFIQWVIEDKFMEGRPEWERTGVHFVNEVDMYEKMKIRLLNAGHSLIGFSGALCGYETIDESVSDPELEKLLHKFMDDEVTPLLGEVDGIDLEIYKNNLVQRFGNPNIRDPLTRICGESSAKIPKFVLPTILEQLAREGPITIGVFVVAAWCRMLELPGNGSYTDAMGEELIQAARTSLTGNQLAFLKMKTIFGELADSRRFVEKYLEIITRLRQDNIRNVIKWMISSQ